jgi:hypothetical protein
MHAANQRRKGRNKERNERSKPKQNYKIRGKIY